MSSRLNEIGRIGRPRGLDGWVRFEPNSTRAANLISENRILYVKNYPTGYRPLRIENYYTEEKRNTFTFFVKFDMITNRTEADSIKDKILFSDQFDPETGPESNDEDPIDYSGYDIVFNDESIGYVLDVMENPAHSILEAKIGKGALLIPIVDEFVAKINHHKRLIHCINLDQLMEEE